VFILTSDEFGNPVWTDDGSGIATGECPSGLVLSYDSFGQASCDPLPIVTLPPVRIPSQPTPAPPPAAPAPAPAPGPPASPVVSRQPGAPAAPYNPPGRIGLWPGPIFNQPAGAAASTLASSTSSTSVGGAVAAEGPIFVDVTNQTNLADNSASNAVQSVADAVYSGINNATNAADSVAQQTSTSIVTALQGTTGAITSGVGQVLQSLLTGIGDLNTSVGGALGDIGTTIGTDLVNQLNPVDTAIAAVLVAITKQIGGLGGSIAAAVAQVIPLIVAAISNPIGLITNVLHTIEGDIAGNLAELAQTPGAIAAAATSLDATLQRTLSSYESFVKSQTGWGDGDTNHSDLQKIWEALAGLTATITGGTNPKPSDWIGSVCGQAEITKLLNSQWLDTTGATGFLSNFLHFALKGLVSIVFYAASVLPAIAKSVEELRQRFDQICPIEPLSASAVVDAMQRGFLSYQEGVVEAAKGNLSETRLKVLSDLATHQMAPAQLLEAVYRGIIPDADFRSALAAQGWTPGQENILRALGVALLTVAESLDLYRRGSIDKTALQGILAAHQYDKTQQDAIASLAFRPPFTQEAIAGQAASDAFTALGANVGPQVFTPPEYVEIAGAAEGLDHSTTVLRWLNHWNTGSFGIWTSLYFRGQITLQTLQAIAGREFIPPEMIPVFIEGQRPLVQFRTISTMLRLKLITADGAATLLRQHGYSDDNIGLLVRYAQRPAPTQAAKNAQALHSASLGIAKEEYIDGSITGDQYLAILTQHGYTVDGANTELQVVNAHQALLRRKENAQLVIDEYGAGLIDEQAALAQLAALGLTVDELARAAHRIRAFRGRNAKHPSEPDLHNFLKNGIITSDQYVAELTAQGYSKSWAVNFLTWRTLPVTPAPGAAAPAPPTAPGG
jgi:hypothetical protein